MRTNPRHNDDSKGVTQHASRVIKNPYLSLKACQPSTGPLQRVVAFTFRQRSDEEIAQTRYALFFGHQTLLLHQ